MDKRQSIKNAILSIVSNYSAQSNLFVSANCKPKQLQNAVNSFACGCELEDIVILIDDSFMKSGKKGYIFSTECLYADDSQLKHKNSLQTSGISMPLRYEELDAVGKDVYVHSEQDDSFSLHYKSGKTITVVSKYAKLLSEILRAVLQELKQEDIKTDSHPETDKTMDASCVSSEAKQPETVQTAPTKQSAKEMLDLGAACRKQNDFEGAVHWYKAALESGELQRASVLSVQYLCGLLYGVEINPNPQMEKAMFWLEKSAQGGYAKAQYKCGEMYINGQGVRQDLKKALEYMEMAAEQGYKDAKEIVPKLKAALTPAPKAETPKPAAQEELSPDEAYAQGMELYRMEQYEQAIPYLKMACVDKEKNQFPDARFAWGWIYENVHSDIIEAVRQYMFAGKAGSVPGKEAFIRLLASGEKTTWNRFVLKQQITTALEWARELAASDNQSMTEYIPILEQFSEEIQQKIQKKRMDVQQETAFNAGIAAYREKDYAEALRQFKIAAKLESHAAMFHLGIMYYNGEGTAIDKVEALRWSLKAAEQGYARAQFNCGVIYYNGEGTAVDKAVALRWFLKAAEQGHVTAQFNCGNMYKWGKGTAVDKAEALRWYLKAAEQGDAQAQFFCGMGYKFGDGTAVDEAEALRWYLKVAEQGSEFAAIAQFVCGEMYYYGEGTAVDKVQSKLWFQKAAEQGNKDAIEFLRKFS